MPRKGKGDHAELSESETEAIHLLVALDAPPDALRAIPSPPSQQTGTPSTCGNKMLVHPILAHRLHTFPPRCLSGDVPSRLSIPLSPPLPFAANTQRSGAQYLANPPSDGLSFMDDSAPHLSSGNDANPFARPSRSLLICLAVSPCPQSESRHTVSTLAPSLSTNGTRSPPRQRTHSPPFLPDIQKWLSGSSSHAPSSCTRFPTIYRAYFGYSSRFEPDQRPLNWRTPMKLSSSSIRLQRRPVWRRCRLWKERCPPQ